MHCLLESVLFCDITRLAGDFGRILKKLEETFKVLAGYMTEIKTAELDKTPKNPKLRPFLVRIL